MLRASVVLRSYNRLPSLCEAVERILEQDYPDFEVIVVDQTTKDTPEQRARLDKLAEDPRLRVERRPPLGSAGCRNEACRLTTGDVIVMLDDDDMPATKHWLSAHMKNFEDPNCLAVSGRHIHEGGQEPPYPDMAKAERKVMTYGILMWQHCYPRVNVRSQTAQNVHGTNASIRRSAIERVGMWDTCTTLEDENSFCYRLLAGKRPGEYLVFDPEAAIIRRMNIVGGLDKRQQGATRFGWRLFHYFHNVVGHYYTARFIALYPAYAAQWWLRTVEWVWEDSSKYRGKPVQQVLVTVGLAVGMPILWPWYFARWARERLTSPAPERGPRLAQRVPE